MKTDADSMLTAFADFSHRNNHNHDDQKSFTKKRKTGNLICKFLGVETCTHTKRET